MPYTCALCGMVSYNAHDEREGYCGSCHLYVRVVEEARALMAAGYTHECSEWRTALNTCAVCGTPLPPRVSL